MYLVFGEKCSEEKRNEVQQCRDSEPSELCKKEEKDMGERERKRSVHYATNSSNCLLLLKLNHL